MQSICCVIVTKLKIPVKARMETDEEKFFRNKLQKFVKNKEKHVYIKENYVKMEENYVKIKDNFPQL